MQAVGFQPHRGQERVIDTIVNKDKKYITVVSPRQQGKSMLLVNLILYYGINDKACKIGVVSPIYSQASKLMEDLYEPIKDSGIIESANFSSFTIKLKTGTKIVFKSAEREDGLRGYTFDYLFVDEAAYIKADAWKKALQPTVLVHGKKAVLFSTPRGRDWFYEMFQMGKDSEHPNHASVRMEQGDNPFIDPEEIEAAKASLPEAIYRAEYLGEFLEGESMVFQNFNVNTFKYKYPQPQGQVYCGLDLGRESDYTVATFMDSAGNVIDIYRENQKDWKVMMSEVMQRVRKWNANLMVETNSMGTVIYEQLKSEWQNTQPFTTSNSSKKDIIESLILAFNENKIAIPAIELCPELHGELEVFEMKYNPKTRNVIYAARPPFHDDMVISLSIANWNRLQSANSGTYAVMGRRR